MKSTLSFPLGSVLRDKTTGFIGKAVAKVVHMYDDDRYQLIACDDNGRPKAPIDEAWVPVTSLEEYRPFKDGGIATGPSFAPFENTFAERIIPTERLKAFFKFQDEIKKAIDTFKKEEAELSKASQPKR